MGSAYRQALFLSAQGFKSGPKQLGFDVSGVVEAVGAGVTRFGIGDAVFGDMAFDGPRAMAEYVTVRESALAAIPKGLTFPEAAALPQAGLLAMLALEGEPLLHNGTRLLVNGAGGGVGLMAIQLAALQEAIVTGVDRAAKLSAIRAAGATHAIDYEQVDFARTGQRYDRILDVVANRTPNQYVGALAPRGRMVAIGGTPGALLRLISEGTVRGLLTGRKLGVSLHKVQARKLEMLAALASAGQLRLMIDSTWTLHDIQSAFQRFASNDFIGKIVVEITPMPRNTGLLWQSG